MKKIDLGQTISVLANIGVFAGIVFLVYEIRQNTLAMESVAAESHMAGAIAQNHLVATNPALASLIAKTAEPFDSSRERLELTDGERVQLANLFSSHLRIWQNAHYQWSRGALELEVLKAYDDSTMDIMSRNSLFREHWSRWKETFPVAFQEHVQALIDGDNLSE